MLGAGLGISEWIPREHHVQRVSWREISCVRTSCFGWHPILLGFSRSAEQHSCSFSPVCNNRGWGLLYLRHFHGQPTTALLGIRVSYCIARRRVAWSLYKATLRSWEICALHFRSIGLSRQPADMRFLQTGLPFRHVRVITLWSRWRSSVLFELLSLFCSQLSLRLPVTFPVEFHSNSHYNR